jgi:hypothetical protein
MSPEEERERASKVLRLNSSSNYNTAVSTKPKPTIIVKRLKLKGASCLQKERANKALWLNCG